MSQNKLVSVIIPCFNYGHLLSEAVDSVLGQSYKNTEIIIINDGSSDNTEAVAKEYSRRYSQVSSYSQKNQGVIKTRNRGIKLAKGFYLIQLDADDRLDVDYINEAVGLAEKKASDIVYSDVTVFGRENKKIEFPDHNIEILKYQNYIHASSLTKRSVFSLATYDPKLENFGYEDWDIFLNACLSGKVATKMKGSTLQYRKHTDSHSRSDLVSSYRLKARIYLFHKYQKKFKNEMKPLEPLIQLFERIQNDYKQKVFELDKVSKDIEQRKEDIKRLEKEIALMRQSNFWKAKEHYQSIRKKLRID